MPRRDKNYHYLKQRVADIEGITPSAVTPKQMAHYFLSNGVDLKGQTQTGYTAKGGGFGIDVSIDPGKLIGLAAEIGINASAARLEQSTILVARGPSILDGAQIAKPIVLSALSGRKWRGELGAEFSLGIGAEVSAGVGTGGAKAEAESDWAEEEEEEAAAFELDDIEAIGVKAGFFVGLKLNASTKAEHYFGVDPCPMYYDDLGRQNLADELGNWLASETRKRHLKRETTEHLNYMRRFVAARTNGNEKLRREVRDSLGLARLGMTETGDFNEHDAGEHLIENLNRLRAGLQRGIYTESLFANGSYGVKLDEMFAKTDELYNKLVPLYGKVTYARSWVKINSVSGTFGGNLGAEAEAEATVSCVAHANLSASGNLFEGQWSKRRTRIVWQLQHGVDPRGCPLICTQDTVINYTSADAQALSGAVEMEAKVGKKKYGYDIGGSVFGKGLNTMTYQSGILYWRMPVEERGEVRPLLGSGVAFGQSVVINNLLKVCEELKKGKEAAKPSSQSIFGPLKGPIVLDIPTASKKQSATFFDIDFKNDAPAKPSPMIAPKSPRKSGGNKWLKRMARSLRVTEEQLTEFLTRADVIGVLEDLSASTQDLGDPNSEPWGDRSVLLESSFSLPLSTAPLTYENNKLTGGVRDKLLGVRNRSLQAIRLRFRISDCFSSQKAFRLGFKVFGTGLGVSFKKISEAGTEGVVTLCSLYFPSSLDANFMKMEESLVPPVTLFSQ